MRSFLKGIKSDFHEATQQYRLKQDQKTEAGNEVLTSPPRKEDWLKYRKHRGVNLGSWFTLERWITDTPFRRAAPAAASDLDVAKGTDAKGILENHWDTWITQVDWDWIAGIGVNSVRIPIGYYHVCGADRRILDDTDFYPFYDVYQGAWKRITEAIQTASRMGMTVLIDLHAAPGKQNADPHSGTSLHANFFNDPHNLRRGLYAVTSLARALNDFCSSQSPPLRNVIGIELLNEPAPPNDTILRDWYLDAVSSVRKEYPGIPIYLGEVWRLGSYADWVSRDQRRLSAPESTGLCGEDGGKGSLVVLDHHLYRCFTPEDNRTSVQDHTRALLDPNGSLQKAFSSASETLGRTGGGMIVGEWSCGLNPGSLRGVPGEKKTFVDAQLAVYEKYCGGWYWWTLKKESEVYGKDVGWSLKDAVEEGVFPKAVPGMKRRRGVDGSVAEQGRRENAKGAARRRAYDAHVAYWRRIGGSYEHHRFFSGFADGWDDAYSFFENVAPDSNTVSEIGFAAAWAKERARGSEHEKARGYWEYEHGVLQDAVLLPSIKLRVDLTPVKIPALASSPPAGSSGVDLACFPQDVSYLRIPPQMTSKDRFWKQTSIINRKRSTLRRLPEAGMRPQGLPFPLPSRLTKEVFYPLAKFHSRRARPKLELPICTLLLPQQGPLLYDGFHLPSLTCLSGDFPRLHLSLRSRFLRHQKVTYLRRDPAAPRERFWPDALPALGFGLVAGRFGLVALDF